MNLQRFASRTLSLIFNVRRCDDGPLAGNGLALRQERP
jgi:hypothetical protein